MKRAKPSRPAVTDRALRYRAQRNLTPGGPECCWYCGSESNIGVDHIDGREENGKPKNLIRACKSCNTEKGIAFKRAGVGRLTRQYNPKQKHPGAQTAEQWVLAVLSMKGKSDAMSVPAAVEMIHETPESQRSKFARQIWKARRRGGAEEGRRAARRAAYQSRWD